MNPSTHRVATRRGRSAVQGFLWLADATARILGWAAMALLVLLVVTMAVEVFSRRVLNSPTQWAFDVSSMSNGAIFVLALAVVLHERKHITVDFLSLRFAPWVRKLIEALFFGLVLTPILVLVAQVAWTEAWDAYVTGRLDRVSPWAPRLWPYFTALALGLSALALQSLAVAIRSALPVDRLGADPALADQLAPTGMKIQ